MSIDIMRNSCLMPRLHLVALMTRNETWHLWKQLSKFKI